MLQYLNAGQQLAFGRVVEAASDLGARKEEMERRHASRNRIQKVGKRLSERMSRCLWLSPDEHLALGSISLGRESLS